MLPDEVRRAWADRCGLPWDENDDRVREPEKYGWPKDFEIFYAGWKSAYVTHSASTPTSEPAAYFFGYGQPLLPEGLTDEQKARATPLYFAQSATVPLVEWFGLEGDGLTIRFRNQKDADAVADALQERQSRAADREVNRG